MPTVDEDNAALDQLPRWTPNAWQTALWAVTPTLALLLTALAEGGSPRLDWESIAIRWTFFLTGIMNMYAFSAVTLRARHVEGWELKAIPVAGALCVANAVLATLVGTALGNVFGAAAPVG